ncbi:fluoride efflux transporter FluC [Streptantibioticus parmotrematis]|uniref:fluoride efflux transporter FluC n=1 Tax=Streptantibioticus parmotrematis TaxID=2873249 RepID=UPI0027E16F0E|nr:CrcB family protein [Streptantibioticus parmotrematis]
MPSTDRSEAGETLPVDPDLIPDEPPKPRRRPQRPRQWDVLAVIAVGGGTGSVARYGLARALPTSPGGFPWATFLTNVSGCFVLGLFMVYVLEIWPPSRYVRPFFGVGVLGGFTTFSTYTVELRGMIALHHWSLADAYALSSLIAGLAAVWTGIVLARRLSGLPVRRGPRRRTEAGRALKLPEPPQEPGSDMPPRSESTTSGSHPTRGGQR